MRNLVFVTSVILLTVCGSAETKPDRRVSIDDPPGGVTNPVWKDVDLGSFELVPALTSLDYGAMNVLEGVDYWELRKEYRDDSTSPPAVARREIIGAAGTKCRTAANLAECNSALRDLPSVTTEEESYFWRGCYPEASCYMYVASTAGQEVRAWKTRAELLTFLDGIEHPHEAALVVHADRYWWRNDNREFGAVRKTKEGLEMIALQGFEDCRIERFLLLVRAAGEVERLREQVAIDWGRDCSD